MGGFEDNQGRFAYGCGYLVVLVLDSRYVKGCVERGDPRVAMRWKRSWEGSYCDR